MVIDHTGVAEVSLPPGDWAVGVSGGADSVALLLLLGDRRPHVVHLDHQARGDDSTADAAFVAELAGRLGCPCTVARMADVPVDNAPRNPSARYRQARLALFRSVVARHGLAGVALAHHADDQAETVAQRLLRGGGPRALGGMAVATTLGGLNVVRPLLHVRSVQLRRYLIGRGQPWREDASNALDVYQRNRVRRWLLTRPATAEAMVRLGDAARAYVAWLDDRVPPLPHPLATEVLARLPRPVGRHAAGRWLVARGASADDVNRSACDRLVAMAADAATPHRQSFPGGLDVWRVRGTIRVGDPRRTAGPTPGPD